MPEARNEQGRADQKPQWTDCSAAIADQKLKKRENKPGYLVRCFEECMNHLTCSFGERSRKIFWFLLVFPFVCDLINGPEIYRDGINGTVII